MKPRCYICKRPVDEFIIEQRSVLDRTYMAMCHGDVDTMEGSLVDAMLDSIEDGDHIESFVAFRPKEELPQTHKELEHS